MTAPVTAPLVSVVVPARNEEALVALALEAVLEAASGVAGGVEITLVDSASSDGTALAALSFAARGVRLARCETPGAARARNRGASLSRGEILVFVDADTLVEPGALRRVCELRGRGFEAGLCRLEPLEDSWRARAWFGFWNQARRLPLARAKAMPAFLFCTRAAWDEFGPFDEGVALGEEWPITAGLWKARPRSFALDLSLSARTSARRMEMQPWGYARCALKYAWAASHPSGRRHDADRFRHTTPATPASTSSTSSTSTSDARD